MDAFIIWTPLHLLNVLTYLIQNDLLEKCVCYFVSQSAVMDSYYDKCIEHHVFSRVYYTNQQLTDKNRKLWEIFSGGVSFTAYARHVFGRDGVNQKYDRLFLSFPNRLSEAIIYGNDCAEIVGIDDGLGSYAGDVYARSLGDKYAMLKKLRRVSPISISRMYLNYPELYHGTRDLQILPLKNRPFTEEEKTLINDIYSFNQEDNYDGYNVIFLNQPLSDYRTDKTYIDVEKKVVALISEKENIHPLVRLHPRETRTDLYEGMDIDESHNLWELMCENRIEDDMCLIAPYSTAQFMPKLIADKEPYLIFTLMLYAYYPAEKKKQFKELIDMLQQQYRHPEKVMCPETIGEFEEILERI